MRRAESTKLRRAPPLSLPVPRRLPAGLSGGLGRRRRGSGRTGRPAGAARTGALGAPRRGQLRAERLVAPRATADYGGGERETERESRGIRGPCNGRSASSSSAVRGKRYFRAAPGTRISLLGPGNVVDIHFARDISERGSLLVADFARGSPNLPLLALGFSFPPSLSLSSPGHFSTPFFSSFFYSPPPVTGATGCTFPGSVSRLEFPSARLHTRTYINAAIFILVSLGGT